MKKLIFAFSIWLLISAIARAEGSGTPDPRTETQNLLKDKTQRQSVIKSNSAAQKADKKVQELTGGNEADTQAIYELTASIFGDMDETKMAKFMSELSEGKLRPDEFAKHWTPEQKAKLSAIVKGIEDRKKKP